jgi:predicted AAA+ superfamily ATPase
MERIIFKHLKDWAADPKRKVLLLRGARQVGKTYAARVLGKSFENFLEINFEEEKPVRDFFSGSLNPTGLIAKLAAYYARPVVPGKTLLFLDEIQSCPEAISSLRFFYERIPELHVIAAGSLLEFALSEIPSFGVGRISSYFMFPMNFAEFMNAAKDKALHDAALAADFDNPLEQALHQRLADRLKEYFLIGGLPDVVQSYLDRNDLRHTQNILDDLISTIKTDFAKYKKKSPTQRIGEVFESVAAQSGSKFMYSNVPSGSSTAALQDSLNLLVDAGIVHKIHHSSAGGIPLGAQANPRKFKAVLFDTGIHQRIIGLDLADYLLAKDFKAINRGSIAEVFTALELISYQSLHQKSDLYYWHREAKSSNAEVDYVIQSGKSILPLEVKAGTKGQMQSLRLFMSEKKIKKGIRISMDNFAALDDVDILPLYAIAKLSAPR